MISSASQARVYPVINFAHPRTLPLSAEHLEGLAGFILRFLAEHASMIPEIIILETSSSNQSSRELRDVQGFIEHIFIRNDISYKRISLGLEGSNSSSGKSGNTDMSRLSDALFSQVKDDYVIGSDQLPPAFFHFWAESAFLNLHINNEILDLHETYLSEYVFAEGYPSGVAGTLISSDILPAITKNGSDVDISRDGFFDVILKDINAYDIETAVSPVDLRMLRLELYRDRSRNSLLCDTLTPLLGPDTVPDRLCSIIQENTRHYRTLPAYFMIQINEQNPNSPASLPLTEFRPDYLKPGRETEPVKFRRIIESILELVEDPVISMSPFTEPALHSEFHSILSIAREFSDNVRFVIETSGIGWTEQAFVELEKFPAGQLDVILCLDAMDPVLYSQLRGAGYEQAMAFADRAAREFSCGLYIQAVRMKENEEHLMNFYNHWKGKNIPVIIQKYNDYSGVLPDRKIADLSPLNRHACWHLKRELVILVNGDVFSCVSHSLAQRINSGQGQETFNLGNVYTDNMNSIWEAGRHLYLRHVDSDYPEICRNCDEWYSFNF